MTDPASPRVWVITGISRGLGLAIAEAALRHGDHVLGTSRDGRVPERLAGYPGLSVQAFDLSAGDCLSVRDAAMAAFGRVDILVNNAGYALIGPVEELSDAAIADQFQVNLLTPLALTRAILPLMRGQGCGHIINISSVAGVAPSAGSAVYAASKAAMNALSVGLSMEVEPLGLHATVIEPGAFRTGFLSADSMRSSDKPIGAYATSSGGFSDRLRAISGAQGGDPERAAKVIWNLTTLDDPPRRLILGSDAVAYARQTLERQFAGLDRWSEVSRSTDFDASGLG